MENFDMYISSDGYFVVEEFDIKYLIDFSESNIPSMPEVTETSARIAGRDGDIVLASTYEPISFEIVCYTEDNLTSVEKVEEESKINSLLESIKNKTKTLAMQKYSKFYNVKYSAALTTVNYPKHLKFSIPLKSSNPYAMNLTKSEESGNAQFHSNTIKEVGAIFTIEGPATLPHISLNDFQMEYDNSLIEGTKLVIDTKNSTATFVDTNNSKTNAMRYYNHQFPKIQPGDNELEILSGIENEEQVKVEWYDLKL